MAFICPKLEEMEKNRATLEAIANIASQLKKEYECSCEYIPPLPPSRNACSCDGCPCPCAPMKQQDEPESCEPPPVMVCYKVPKQKSSKQKHHNKHHGDTNEVQETVYRLTQSKSRELRSGIMYVGCDCEKRNGLQDDCQRTECHGSPECLTRPNPTCGPSEFANGKHLEKIWGSRGENVKKNGKNGSVGNTGGDGIGGPVEDEYEYHCFPATVRSTDMDPLCLCR